jgi:hypothetical protein
MRNRAESPVFDKANFEGQAYFRKAAGCLTGRLELAFALCAFVPL